MKNLILKIKNKYLFFTKNFGKVFLLILILFLFLILIYFYTDVVSDKKLIVRFLDIGQGDSILIKTPDNKNILIDAGQNEKALNKVEKYISIFRKNIDLAIMSHPDMDHIGGYYDIFQKYNIRQILENGDNNKDNPAYQFLKEKIEGNIDEYNIKKILANCGDKIIFGDNEDFVSMYILHPVKEELIINDSNDNSIVILLVYKDYSFLFTGDAGKDVEQKLFFDIKRCFNDKDAYIIEKVLAKLTVLKVSHHGSDTGNSEAFLKKIRPVYNIVSVGENNKYGHPKEEVLKTLNKYSKNTLTTIEKGDIAFIIKDNDLQLEFEK